MGIENHAPLYYSDAKLKVVKAGKKKYAAS